MAGEGGQQSSVGYVVHLDMTVIRTWITREGLTVLPHSYVFGSGSRILDQFGSGSGVSYEKMLTINKLGVPDGTRWAIILLNLNT